MNISLQFLVMSFSDSGIRIQGGILKYVGIIFFYFLEDFLQNWCYFLLKCLDFSEAIWALKFSHGQVSNYILNLFDRYRPLQVIYFFIKELWQFVSLKELVFHVERTGIKLFIMFCYPFLFILLLIFSENQFLLSLLFCFLFHSCLLFLLLPFSGLLWI